MVSHMKTTIQLPDSLYKELHELARREHTTMKSLFEEGVRYIITRKRKSSRFRLRKATFKGKGINLDFQGASWDHIRKAIYEERGG
jgi:hypothetical protein